MWLIYIFVYDVLMMTLLAVVMCKIIIRTSYWCHINRHSFTTLCVVGGWLRGCVTLEEWRTSCTLINRHVHSENVSHFLSCGEGKIINLISYRLYKSGCNSTEELGPSSDVKAQLYEMCSMQEKCKQLPNVNLEEGKPYAISTRYDCIETTKLVDICENITKLFQDTMHLIVPNSSESSMSICECFIKSQDNFGIKVNDERLPRNKSETCSDSNIVINDIKPKCERVKVDNNSYFQTQLSFKWNRAHLLIKTNTAAPRMERLFIEVKGSSVLNLSCTATPRLQKERLNVSKMKNIENDTSSSPNKNGQNYLILLSTCLTGSILMLILIAVRCNSCGKKKRKKDKVSTRQKIEKEIGEENKMRLRDECSQLVERNSVSRLVNQSPLTDLNLYDIIVENEYDASKHASPSKQEGLSYDHIHFKEKSRIV